MNLSYRILLRRRRRLEHALAATLVVLVCGAVMAAGGEVVCRDGRVLRGDIEFKAGALGVKSAGGESETVPLNELRRAEFSVGPTASASGNWQSADLGEVYTPGDFVQTNKTLTLRASGWGFWPNSDGFRLAWQPLNGDGQIVARIEGCDDKNGTVFAGVTIRESLSPSAPHATAVVASANRMQMRARPGGSDEFVMTEEIKASPWLRVSRRGNVLTAYHSTDGANWTLLEQLSVTMRSEVLAGVVAATRVNSAVGAATFASVVVTAGQPVNGPADLPAPGVVLRDGTVLSGRATSDDGKILQIRSGAMGDQSLPVHRLAALLFRPAPASVAQVAAQPVRRGLWLLSGDSVDGELVSLSTNRVTLESVLLGAKKYDLAENAVAFVFDGVTGAEPAWTVGLRDGSRLKGTALTVTGDQLTMDNPFLGRLTVPCVEVRSLAASGAWSSPPSTGQ